MVFEEYNSHVKNIICGQHLMNCEFFSRNLEASQIVSSHDFHIKMYGCNKQFVENLYYHQEYLVWLGIRSRDLIIFLKAIRIMRSRNFEQTFNKKGGSSENIKLISYNPRCAVHYLIIQERRTFLILSTISNISLFL